MVDWMKPIEAVEKATGRVVPMEFLETDAEHFDPPLYLTTESPAHNSNIYWRKDGRDNCSIDAWFIRNVEEARSAHTHTYDFATMTVTGIPVPEGFAEVMKHTIVGSTITGIVIDAPYSLSIQTPNGTFEFRVNKIN